MRSIDPEIAGFQVGCSVSVKAVNRWFCKALELITGSELIERVFQSQVPGDLAMRFEILG